MAGTGQSSEGAFDIDRAELDGDQSQGPVEPVIVLAAILELTQTASTTEATEQILGSLATPPAALEVLRTPTLVNAFLGQITPTPNMPVGVGTSPTHLQEKFLPTEEPVKPVVTPKLPAPPIAATPTEAPESPTPTATPMATSMPAATPEPSAPADGGETSTATPFGTPAPISTVDPTLVTPTPSKTPRPTRTPNPIYPTPTTIPEGTFLDIVDIVLSPGNVIANSGDEFILSVVVEPNGQEVSAVQVFLTYDTRYLEALSSELDPYSPLTTQLSPDNLINSGLGTVFLSSGPYWQIDERPSTSFTLGFVTFEAKNADVTTEIEFQRFGVIWTAAGIEGVDITDDLEGSTITIVQPPPTATPIP